MSDSPHSPAPDDAPQPNDVPAQVPAQVSTEVPAEIVPETPGAPAQSEEVAATDNVEEPRPPDDPEALANDRAGFKFLAIGFALFFALIAICAGIVAAVMKNMGI